jgi:ribose 5-phosphate isomerase B
MKIAVASDHGGFNLKELIKEHLFAREIDVIDLGTYSDKSVDYPIYGKSCGEYIASGLADLGIVFCGSGIGISIAANKVKGIRCAVCTDVVTATLAKEHNDANIISLGGRTNDAEQAKAIVDAWLDGTFLGNQHKRRIDLLDEM